jgi:probable rRNA maturation factor
MKPMVKLNLSNQTDDNDVPTDDQFTQWVMLATNDFAVSGDININIVSRDEIQQMNAQFRHKNKPTNVLSFPFEAFPGIPVAEAIIGDIAICASVVKQEAEEQQKPLIAHWAHLCIHGVLHLLGFDHQTDEEALKMETIEINLLKQLGYPNPYE